jgi:hypothetical protein
VIALLLGVAVLACLATKAGNWSYVVVLNCEAIERLKPLSTLSV